MGVCASPCEYVRPCTRECVFVCVLHCHIEIGQLDPDVAGRMSLCAHASTHVRYHIRGLDGKVERERCREV